MRLVEFEVRSRAKMQQVRGWGQNHADIIQVWPLRESDQVSHIILGGLRDGSVS